MKTKLVIFGITGDLSCRKLLPALAEIVATGDFEDLSIIGVSRRDVVIPELLADQLNLTDRTNIFTMDLAEAADYRKLSDYLALETDEQALIYLAVPPTAATDIVELLGQAGLNTPNVKILFEKPFGFDLESAKDAIERTSHYFSEDQLYRIDHYMAKEVARDIIKLRNKAENHQHGWSNVNVAAVDVVASENIGVEGRGTFYEPTGALRDFIQGHLMQLLSLVLMDIPAGSDPMLLPKYRLEALEYIQAADPALAQRAQYKGYQEEVGNPGSLTETFASVELSSVHPRWKGVPIHLVTGKALAKKRAYVTVTYTDGSQDTFEETPVSEGLHLPDAYERVLVDAINDRKSIFTTSPEVLRSWAILAPVQEAWDLDDHPLPLYTPGAEIIDITG